MIPFDVEVDADGYHVPPTDAEGYLRDEFLFSWESQVVQYPQDGPAGISYFKGDIGETKRWVDCLLYRDKHGEVIGILNFYAFNFPPHEREGNFNIWVRPDHQREGIGTALLREATERFGIDFDRQRYTRAGKALSDSFRERYLGGH